MPPSDPRSPLARGLTAVAVGGGRGVAPLDHLGPHNALEWVVYLALLAIFAAVVVHEWRNRNAIPGFRAPRRRKPRGVIGPGQVDGPPPAESDDRLTDPTQGRDEI